MTDRRTDKPANAHEELEIARAAVQDAYERFLDAKKHLQRAAMAAGLDLRESAQEQLDAALARARFRKDAIHDNAETYVRENPLTSAGLAFVTGLVVSRLFGK